MRNRSKPNIGFIVLFLLIAFFLYSQNKQVQELNTRLTDIEEKRLKLIEDKFGGEKSLKCSESETVKKVKASIVRVIGGEGEGSGFMVNDNGYILTNFHVIEFEPAPKIMFSDNTFETPVILFADKSADLAILKVDKKIPAITWGNSDNLNPTDEVLAFGFPFGSQIAGDVTVKKGSLSAKRTIKDKGGLEFLQIDSTLNPGMSGGPLITVCGDFVGINTASAEGLGLAISSNSFKQKYLEMLASNEPLKDIKQIVFDPNKSPLDAVEAFYNYIKIRKLDKAFALLGEKFTEGMTFENWKKGYSPNIDTSLLKIENDPDKDNVVKIKLGTKDLVGDEIVYKYFEGWWEVKEIDGNLKLWWPEIKEVKNPDWLWFYE
ncbi:hypothetical protein A3C25_02525 [Candidatus Roizmanbacteria bacterium RIFCSPHIGHO2_02_FULL_38_11]|uniref:Uncharacterized protein n=1 Tax=Candidatus Roizmanbacteria bacterium RIFCSPHIGHO2_02_FULL_38_11 TaxID=1802039 RepID=A0A1F7H325_9BACT|nr:MAG: hypothetical protein A3C25_02525 [Candidatus Roizmanbacteria bacterium RIFCSPHIGHO2_02_FULL_38_11]